MMKKIDMIEMRKWNLKSLIRGLLENRSWKYGSVLE